MDIPDGSIVFSKEVIEFVTAANEYCLLLEKVHDFEKKEFINRTQKLLPLIYFKAAVLPQPRESINEVFQKFVTEADWHFIEQQVLQKLGTTERFVETEQPAEKLENEEVSLSECFADIYQDLKDFTALYQTGSEPAINEALWELIENFEQVWGPRLLALLKALHGIIFSDEDLSDDHNRERPVSRKHYHEETDDTFQEIDPKNLFG